MTAATIITLRETLEASLVVGIVLSYLSLVDQRNFNRFVWMGVLAGIATSIVLAIVFTILIGGFTGRAEEITEGIMMLTAAGLISWMILWMQSQKRTIRESIERKAEGHVARNSALGLFALIFFAVLREGIETVLFLHAAYLQSGEAFGQLIGSVTGIATAIVVSILFFKFLKRSSLKLCFSITTTLLILFAAGLVAHGIHELQEAGLIPIVIEHVWDMNAVLNEKGAVGAMLKSLFGYNGNPSLLEVMGYVLYLSSIMLVSRTRFSR